MMPFFLTKPIVQSTPRPLLLRRPVLAQSPAGEWLQASQRHSHMLNIAPPLAGLTGFPTQPPSAPPSRALEPPLSFATAHSPVPAASEASLVGFQAIKLGALAKQVASFSAAARLHPKLACSAPPAPSPGAASQQSPRACAFASGHDPPRRASAALNTAGPLLRAKTTAVRLGHGPRQARRNQQGRRGCLRAALSGHRG